MRSDLLATAGQECAAELTDLIGLACLFSITVNGFVVPEGA